MKISKNLIELSREISDLDKFVIDFINILKKHTDYVIISGYVAILLGRSRGTEDIDIIIPRLEKQKVEELVKELNNRFYCLNTEKEIFEYLDSNSAVRFAYKDMVIPNMEMKFSKNKVDDLTLKEKIKVKMDNIELFISNLELQVAYKEEILKSPKDMEDARHLRQIGKLNNDQLNKYKMMLNE